MNKIYLTVLTGILALSAASASAAPMDKNTVLQLSNLGLGDSAIVAKIEADKVDFDLSTDDMIALKKQGVSSAVIAAMISNRYVPHVAPSLDSPDPSVPHPAGLYVMEGNGVLAHMQKMEPTVTNQAKTGGIFGYALTGGLASLSVKAAIQNETSKVPTGPSPQFYFFSAQSNGSDAGAWSSGANTVVSSPAELTLIRLNQKQGRREARVGSMNIGGAKTGVMDKDRIEFTYKLVRPGVYLVEPKRPLERGEYGFMYALEGTGSRGAMTARVFDFTVN